MFIRETHILKYVSVIFIFLNVTLQGISQETAPWYLLPGVHQQSYSTPAVQNESAKLVVGLPFLAGISGTWNANTPFDALFSKGFSYSLERFYNQLEPQGSASASGRLSMFYASLRHADYTFRLSVSERFLGTGKFDRDIVKIIRDGTQPYFGANENFGEAGFHFQFFRELSFGVSKRVWESLDIGIAPKILFGKAAFDGSGLQVSVETDKENNMLLVKPEGTFWMAGPLAYNYSPVYYRTEFRTNFYPGDYFFQPRNLGFAVDFGVIYRPNEFAELSASLLDFGFTSFKYNTYDVDFSEPANFSEDNLYQSTNPDGENYLEPREAIRAFRDSLSFLINAEETDSRKMAPMPATINLSARTRVSEKLTGGVNNQFTWFRNKPRNYFTAFIQSYTGKKVGLAASLSLYNLSDIRPGFGVSYTSSRIQFYFSSNNILPIIQPASAKHLNLSVGINFLFDTQ